MRIPFAALAAACALALAPALAAPAKGRVVHDIDRLHAVHEKKVGMECSDCHARTHVDILLMKKYEARGDKPVDRNACVACHRQPRRPAWYGPAAK